MKQYALISVSDRKGLRELGEALVVAKIEILATSGSRRALEEFGIPSISLEQYTGQREILDGRVKTLHPKVHAGLLARIDRESDRQELEDANIGRIVLAAVNLYPFGAALNSEKTEKINQMIELIDVGGPTMIRAAAKNHQFVLPLIDPIDYAEAVAALRSKEGLEGISLPRRRELALKVFTQTAQFDSAIARYLSNCTQDGFTPSEDLMLGGFSGVLGERTQILRYGENPHQQAAFYGAAQWKQHGGKELSYNNLLDFDATARILRTFADSAPTAIIVKHLNPCGIATSGDLLSALEAAKRSDPRSHFGGVLGFNGKVTQKVAQAITQDFCEIVLAPAYEADALEVLRSKANLRILECSLTSPNKVELRSIGQGFLVQQSDLEISRMQDAEVVSARKPSERELQDLEFAWKVCAHVKSNAIVIAKDRTILGVGAGQMSRIDSVEVAISKATHHGHDLRSAVAASDAFFPFPDNVEALAKAGVKAIVAPKGAKKDNEAIKAADQFELALLFTKDRHFRH